MLPPLYRGFKMCIRDRVRVVEYQDSLGAHNLEYKTRNGIRGDHQGAVNAVFKFQRARDGGGGLHMYRFFIIGMPGVAINAVRIHSLTETAHTLD